MGQVNISIDQARAKVSLISAADVPGMAARIFEILTEWGIEVSLVVQNSPQPGGDAKADMSFLVLHDQLADVRRCLDAMSLELSIGATIVNPSIGVLTVDGVSPEMTFGVQRAALYARAFGALGAAGINLLLVSAEGPHISLVTTADDAPRAALVLSETFASPGI